MQSSAGRRVVCSARGGLSRVCYAGTLYPSNEGNPLVFWWIAVTLLWPGRGDFSATFKKIALTSALDCTCTRKTRKGKLLQIWHKISKGRKSTGDWAIQRSEICSIQAASGLNPFDSGRLGKLQRWRCFWVCVSRGWHTRYTFPDLPAFLWFQQGIKKMSWRRQESMYTHITRIHPYTGLFKITSTYFQQVCSRRNQAKHCCDVGKSELLRKLT